MLDGCLYDDVLPIANLEPGVSGRNSLPLPGTPGPRPLRNHGFWTPLGVTLDAPWVALDAFLVHLGSPWSLFLSSRGRLGLTFSILGVILSTFFSYFCMFFILLVRSLMFHEFSMFFLDL